MLALKLVFELLYSSRFSALLAILVAGKGCGPIFEKLLLPVVEDLRLKLILVAQIRDRDAVDQVTFEDANLLFWGVVVTLLAHVLSSVCECLSQTA